MMGGGAFGGGMMGNPYMMGGGMMNPYMMGGGMNPYMMGGGYGYPGGAQAPAGSPFATPASVAQPNVGTSPGGVTTATGATGTDQTGQYMGNMGYPGAFNPNAPRVVPNPFNNSLMIQARPADYEQILKLLRDMDIPPRQVLIDARIYEVTLDNAFSSGIAATFQDKSTGTAAHHFFGALTGAGATNLTDGFLVGRTKELLAAVQLLETEQKARSLAAPSVIATDSIAANINVGEEVPVLTAQAVTGAQQGGTSLFANTVSNVNTGVTLNITAQVNPSGIVTLMINQDVSAPGPPPAGGPQSSTFSKRTVNTQVTVQDGDTIAIGGIIQETNGFSTTGIPGLNRIPILGAAFGSRSYTKHRSELIIFMTPHVIYDTNQIQEASDQLEQNLKMLRRHIKDEQ
jgi:general secretion pathway protein D